MAPLQASFQNVTSLKASIRTENTFISSLLQEFSSQASPIDLTNIKYNPNYTETGDSPPVFAKPRPLPEDKFRAQNQNLIFSSKIGIIRPLKTSWTSPLPI